MRTHVITTVVAFVFTLGLNPQVARADHHEGVPAVLQVFTIDAAAKDRPAVLERLKKLQAILAKEGQPKFRVWLGSYAGENVGQLFITIERKNYADFGVNQGKVMSSDAVSKWIADIDNSGISKLVGQSLLTDVTP